MKLNLGVGGKAESGYINTDIKPYPGVNKVFDFNHYPWPFNDNEFEEVKILNCIHCAKNEIRFMEEVWRITKRGGKVIIESPVFNSPIYCQDPYIRLRIGYMTFDKYCEELRTQGISYESKAVFKYKKRRWIFSDNPYLKWLSFLPNIFPKFYARFFYYYFPSNKLHIELEVI